MRYKEAIARFVRESLGCQCPDEIFEQIEAAYGIKVGGIPILARIVIGNRLLIFVIELTSHSPSAPSIEKLIHAGKNERNGRGLNRFRLVIVSEDADFNRILVKKFDTEEANVEKIHFHIVSRKDPHLKELLSLGNKKIGRAE